jgi:hypothetical protein
MIVRCKRFFESTERFTLRVEEVAVNLVRLPKNPWIVGSKKFFVSTEGVPGFEEGVV